MAGESKSANNNERSGVSDVSNLSSEDGGFTVDLPEDWDRAIRLYHEYKRDHGEPTIILRPNQMRALIELCEVWEAIHCNVNWWESEKPNYKARLILFWITNDIEAWGYASSEEISVDKLAEALEWCNTLNLDKETDFSRWEIKTAWAVMTFDLKMQKPVSEKIKECGIFERAKQLGLLKEINSEWFYPEELALEEAILGKLRSEALTLKGLQKVLSPKFAADAVKNKVVELCETGEAHLGAYSRIHLGPPGG